MKRFFPLLCVALVFCILPSCRFLSGVFWDNSDKIAQIGSSILYNRDVQPMIPMNLSGPDSINRIRQCIDTWATDNLLLSKAEKMLSAEEKDVEKELENYRRSLLVYRYQKKYVEDRLDTLVSEREIEEFYKSSPELMELPGDLLKARLIKIRLISPYIEMVRNLYSKTTAKDSLALETLCHDAADEFTYFNNQWISLELLSKQLPDETEGLAAKLKTKPYLEIKDNLYSYLIYCFDYITAGHTAPLDYKRDAIAQMIISQRKQELLRTLSTDVLNEAWNTGQIKLFNHNE